MHGTFRLGAFYVVFFLQVGIYVPYWPIWLASEGMSPSRIGVLLGSVAWARLFVAPYAGTVADRARSLRGLLTAFAACACVGYLTLASAGSFGAFFLGMALVGLGNAPLVPIVDAWVLKGVDAGVLKYGRVRLWGSASFVLATAACGFLLEGTAPVWIYRSVLILAFCLVIACALLPNNAVADREGLRAVSTGALLKQPGFLRFLVAATALHTSHSMLGGFASLHWRENGGIGPATIGWLWAESVLFEILVFAIGHRLLARIGLRGLLLAASLAGLVRWPLLSESLDLRVLVVAQALHGLSFGAAHLGCIEFVRGHVSPPLRHTASALYTASVMGLGFGLAMPVAGWLYGSLGARAFWVMMIPSLLGGLLGVTLERRVGWTSKLHRRDGLAPH